MTKLPRLVLMAAWMGLCGLAQSQVPSSAAAGAAAGLLPGQSVTLLRATELRADKLASAPVLQALAAGAAVRLQSVEGGWLLVEANAAQGSGKNSGWMRASAANLQSAASAVSGLSSGREAAGSSASAPGVRNLQARSNRHALIIGISRYADPATPPLPGARIDRQSATQMAQAMQVPASNIRYLQDDEATGNNIRKAVQELTDKVQLGDHVFIHY